ncbi:hypothetical protein PORY_001447 [Pneumocystis oryctolagi]|uniref:Uncharacterized protein n=1 Tax=Pneumocystis oryctolagi TaxID=42067 RepID=A0ACB7CFJ7_9ASCO|nr:hypothetical protein PORY_001447 [Pneumocystis oryctolagi]
MNLQKTKVSNSLTSRSIEAHIISDNLELYLDQENIYDINKFQENKTKKKTKKSKILTESLVSPGSALNKISNQRLIFDLSAESNPEQTESYYIKEDRIYISPFIKNIVNQKKNLWKAVSRDVNGELIGEKNKLFFKKSEKCYQSSIQCVEISKAIEYDINRSTPLNSYKHNTKKKNVDYSFNSNFIIINSSGSEDELLLDCGDNLEKKYSGKIFKPTSVLNFKDINNPSLIKNPIVEDYETEESCVKDFFLKDFKSEKVFVKKVSEHNDIDLNNVLFTENFVKDEFLSETIKNDMKNNILNEYKFNKENCNLKKQIKTVKTNKKNEHQITVMPDFQKYTLSQLQSEFLKYGFKTVQTKEAMINLLTKYWEISCSLNKMQLTKNDDEFNNFNISQTLNDVLLKQSGNDFLQDHTVSICSNDNLQCIFIAITKLLKSTEGEIYWFKILHYEPIILEIFTKWLFKHNIIVPLDIVKQYCNMYGICFVHFKTNNSFAKKYL